MTPPEGPSINDVRTRGKGLTYLVTLAQKRTKEGDGSKFARTLFMNGPLPKRARLLSMDSQSSDYLSGYILIEKGYRSVPHGHVWL